MAKSPDAFRTISEVAEWLGVQAHVLRFWESKFSQVKPIKRAGGRRYYRPTDMLLLGGIKKLLHDDGMTIKGAQKLLREKGNAFVADLSQPLDDLTVAVIEGTAEDVTDKVQAAQAETPALPADADTLAAPDPEPEVGAGPEHVLEAEPEPEAADDHGTDAAEAAQEQEPSKPDPDAQDAEDNADTIPVMPSFRAHHARHEQTPEPSQEDPAVEDSLAAGSDAKPPEKFEVTPPAPKDTPKPRVIDVGPLPDLADFPDPPSILSSIAQIKSLSSEDAAAIQPLLARLTRLRTSMASPHTNDRKE